MHLDSGCNTVVTGNVEHAQNCRPLPQPIKVHGAFSSNSTFLEVTQQCDLVLECKTEQGQIFTLRFRGALFHPRFRDTLLSTDVLLKQYGWRYSVGPSPENPQQVQHALLLEPYLSSGSDRIICVTRNGTPTLPARPASVKLLNNRRRSKAAPGVLEAFTDHWISSEVVAHACRVRDARDCGAGAVPGQHRPDTFCP